MDEKLRGRFETLKRFKQEHGGIEYIPEELLDKIKYIRYEDESTGEIQVVPIEVFAARAMTEQARSKEQEIFNEITFEVSASEGYSTSLTPSQVQTRLERLFNHLEPHNPPWANYSLRELGHRLTCVPIAAEGDQGERYIVFPTSFCIIGDAVINEIDLLDYLECSEEEGGRYDAAAAARAWERLQVLKSHIADVDEIEKLFVSDFGSLMLDSARSKVDNPRMTLQNVVSGMSYEDLERNYIINPQAVMSIIADELAQDGFVDVADQLRATDSLPAMRSILEDALRTCATVRQFKAQEAELKSERRHLQDAASIFEWNRQLSALRSEHKVAMKTLYGVRDFLNIPTILGKYIRQNIDDIQKSFKRIESSKKITITLDGSFDEQLDKDPGKVSGDCTEGDPLPFDAKVGAHNVKVRVEGEHEGNIYLLDAKTEDGARIWHLDAIQIPSGRIDWAEFPAVFTEQIATKAREAGVSAITVNSSLVHISNYDYVARAIFNYLNAPVDDIERAAMQDRGEILTTNVIFPQIDGYSKFQGEGEEQFFLWKRQGSSS